MVAYPISDIAEDQYRGCGCALAAIIDGQAIAITYLRAVVPDIHVGDIEEALTAMEDDRLALEALRLGAQGDVVLAMCSSWEVVELAPAPALPVTALDVAA